MKQSAASGLLNAFRALSIASPAAARPAVQSKSLFSSRIAAPSPFAPRVRQFSATAIQAGTWLEPSIDRKKKKMKGRPRVATGGSTKGTTVVWGEYGLRMKDHHRRISAAQLKCAEDAIKLRLRGNRYRLYKRVAANMGVFISGNEVGSSAVNAIGPSTCLHFSDAYGQGKGILRSLGGTRCCQPNHL